MTEQDTLTEILCEEERGAVASAIDARLLAIQHLPQGLLRARLFSAALLTGGCQLMREFEGSEATIRQLRRLADLLEMQGRGLN